MAKDSGIEWTHHTFNPWWGCVKISPACTHCYAEKWARRVGMDLWGGDTPRRFFGDNHWKDPVRWNAEAKKMGTRSRVFCASMADVFEPRKDLDSSRERLWALIEQTPYLDWLLLTKRPGHIKNVYPWIDAPRENVWLGTTAENQKCADRRIDHLVGIDARVHFLSCEPLFSAIDLSRWFEQKAINWVIAGGESGGEARPTHPNWIRSLRDQCKSFGVPFHFKQWGHWSPEAGDAATKKVIQLQDEAGQLERLLWQSKKTSGRVLDGRTWDGYPTP
jgi:protein gp37